MIKKFILKLLKLYKRYISPCLPPSCRYYPTCSEYTFTAVEKYGVIKGVVMGVFRILRCNILFPGGYDPVP